MDEFGRFDEFDIELSNITLKEKSETDKHPELSSIIPKCEQGLECDNCGFCH